MGITLPILRSAIDRLDVCLLEVLSARQQLALLVEQTKREKDLPILCPERKAEKLAKLIEIGARLDPPLDAGFITAVWELLHGYAVEQELLQRQRAGAS